MTHLVLRAARYPREEKDLDAGGDLVSQRVLEVPAAEAPLRPATWEQAGLRSGVWAPGSLWCVKRHLVLGSCSGAGGAAAAVIGSSASLRVEALVFYVYGQTAM